MFSRISKPFALGLKGVRTFYGKTFPDRTLKFVQVFHRHGDRTPLHNYFAGTPQEQDEVQLWKQYIPNKEEFEQIYDVYKYQHVKPNVPCDPVFGQITHEGIVQMKNVGKQLRKYYMEEEPFISDNSFNNDEISLRSTCRDRTLHSIQALVSTLFPVSEYKPHYPIIKINTDDTCCLNKFDTHCKKETARRISMYDWQCYLDSMKQKYFDIVAKELPYFADESKLKWTDIMDFVITRYNHLLDIPEPIYAIFPEVYRHNTHKFDIIYNSPKCLHCFVDDLFAMIRREVDGVHSGERKTKLSIYSCHDTSILPLLNVLTPYWPSEVPRYGANICLEYWENNFTKGIEVAMRYNGEYQPIFVENYQEALIVDYKDFCTTLTIPKHLLEVMRDKNKVPVDYEYSCLIYQFILTQINCIFQSLEFFTNNSNPISRNKYEFGHFSCTRWNSDVKFIPEFSTGKGTLGIAVSMF